jgi:hypothetical protein
MQRSRNKLVEEDKKKKANGKNLKEGNTSGWLLIMEIKNLHAGTSAHRDTGP